MKKAEAISGVWLILSIAFFIVSHFLWGKLPEDVVNKIYFISILNVGMVAGLVLTMVSRGNTLHIAGTGMMCLFSWLLMMELFGDATDWTNWNIGTFLINGVTSIFISLKLKKYKDNAVG